MNKHYRKRDLFAFTLPSIAMMLFTSLYGIVDGFFVSNWCGATAFAAINFVMPVIMIFGSVGFMVGVGGSALVSKVRGEGDEERANRYFSLFTYATIAIGIVLAITGYFAMRPIAALMGAEGELLDIAVVYGHISMVSIIPYMLQTMFQPLFSAAGKPGYGLRITLASGIANMVLDALFVGALGWGVPGAAWATVVSECVGGIVPLWYFARKHNTSYLCLGTPFAHIEGNRKIEWRALGKVCVNGSSEMMANIAMSIVSILYNYQLLRYLGETGVAAYGAIMYVALLFAGAIMGYSMGAAPLMSYQFGAQNRSEMRSLFKNGLILVALFDVVGYAFALVAGDAVMGIFTGYDAELHAFSNVAFREYSLCLLIVGFSVYASGLFTALNNGLISALIEFLRTLVFECGAVLIIPMFFGGEAIFYSVVVAEVFAVMLSTILVAANYKKYFADPMKE